MNLSPESFYDDMASSYHLIFDDWDKAIERQRQILTRLLPVPDVLGKVLDCACGIGTQSLGLARAGYEVNGTDISKAAVARAQREAAKRNLTVEFCVDDMTLLTTREANHYGAVVAFDNAIPHLQSDEEIVKALAAMRRVLRAGGQIFFSLRDYGALLIQRPGLTPPTMFMDNGLRRMVHQVWDWHDERRYTIHLYITRQTSDRGWQSSHYTGNYRAVTPTEIAALTAQAGFQNVRVLSSATTGFYQPIVTAASP